MVSQSCTPHLLVLCRIVLLASFGSEYVKDREIERDGGILFSTCLCVFFRAHIIKITHYFFVFSFHHLSCSTACRQASNFFLVLCLFSSAESGNKYEGDRQGERLIFWWGNGGGSGGGREGGGAGRNPRPRSATERGGKPFFFRNPF